MNRFVASIIVAGVLPLFASVAHAANSPPAMIVPGQFNVSSTGAATYTIPIAVPPGTAGMVPALSLDYSSQSGDGIEGIGWTLSGLPSVTRCPRTVAQDSGTHGSVNYDTNDKLCMEGQRLIIASGSYGTNGAQYRTEIDSFSKIVEHNGINATNAWFEVWTKAGQYMQFGNSTDSQILTVGLSTNVIRAWAVNRIADTVGNYLTVTYNCGAVGGSCTDRNRTVNGEAYPLEIDYTGNASAGVSPYNSVRFSYYLSRADTVPMYQAGAVTQTTVLLTDIKTYQGANLVHDYVLGYRAGTTTTHSRLTTVTLYDGSGNSLNATNFGWQGGTAGLTLTNSSSPTIAFNQIPFPGDFNNDGITDVLPINYFPNCPPYPIYNGPGFTASTSSFNPPLAYTADCQIEPQAAQTLLAPNGTSNFLLPIWSTDGMGNYDSLAVVFNTAHITTGPYMLPVFPLAGGSSLPPVFGGDFNGDGIPDVMIQGTPSYAHYGNSSGTFGSAVSYGNYNPATVTMGIGDFDGDGCADIYSQTGTTPTVTYASACNPATGAASTLPTIGSGYAPVFGDFNGDGKMDILLVSSSGSAQLWLATGTGFTEINSSVTSSSDWGKYTIEAGDWNGDGKADILLVADGSTGHYGSGTSHKLLLSTGSDFTPALDGGGSPITAGTGFTCSTANACVDAVAADWNSDGVTDIWLQQCYLGYNPLCSSGSSNDELYTFTYTPELITSVSNGVGSTTNITYAPLNTNGTFYAKGSSATFPNLDIDGPLYVVSRVDASNGLGTCNPPSMANCYSSTYVYAGAQSNLQGRGFLGFTTVAITDLQTNIVQTTTYSTAFPYIGLAITQTKTHTGNTHALNSVSNTYSNNSSCGSGIAPPSGIYDVCLTQSVSSGYDLNDTAQLPTTTTTYTYDSDGNALTVNVSVYDPHTATTSYKNTTNTYSDNASLWLLGRLATTAVNSIVGASNLTRHSSFSYDSSTGLLTQEVVESGINTCNSGSSSCTLTTTYTYDAYGHRVTTTVSGSGITTRTSTAGYDPVGEFQIYATNALGQAESWGYDQKFGEATSHTGPNGLTTTWAYDTFGRMTLETLPDGTETSESYNYCSGSCPTYGQFYAQTEQLSPGGSTQIGPISTVYYDMLSRGVANDTQGFDGSNIRVATVYDANGRVNESSRPYFTSGGSPKWTVYSYDALGRVTQATFPDASHTTYGFNGLVTTVTNNLSQTTTTTKNGQGLVSSVQDAASHTTSYVYDAFDNAKTITDPAGNVVSNSYDIRGNKYASSDPDMGSWSYVHDVLGELTSQVDAKSQTTTLSYDLLDRLIERAEPGLDSVWTYGTSSGNHNIGQVVEAKACTASGCATLVSDRTFGYDSLGRPNSNMLQIPSGYFGYSTTYNATNGQIDTVTSPTGFAQRSIYNQYGYLCLVVGAGGSPTCTNAADASVIYAVNARDAELHLLQSVEGYVLTANQTFDPNTGLIQSVRAASSGTVASFDYTFDTIGNLTARNDNVAGFTEKYCYDPMMNRLTNSATGASVASCTSSGAGITTKSVAYDSIGDITTKSDIGTYHYPASGSARPHAVSSITGTVDGLTNPLYGYDGDGNLTCVSTGTSCTGTIGRTVSLTSFNMAGTLVQGSTTVAFTYDDQHQRIVQASTVSGTTTTTVYLNDPTSGAMAEQVAVGSGQPTFIDYVRVGGQIVAQRTMQYQAPLWGSAITWGAASPHPFLWGVPTGSLWGSAAGTNPPRFKWGTDPWSGNPNITWAYFVLDSLGSVAVLTDQSGKVAQRLSYDAWGKQRNSNGTDAVCGSITSSTTRGFTNQEQVPGGCTVNLNARLYDPSIGKFMAPDSVVGDAYLPNAYNRYAYVLNNPLSFTDPSGQCIIGICTWFRSSIVRALVGIVAIFTLQEWILPELELGSVSINAFAEIGLSGSQAASILGYGFINAGISGGIAGAITSGNLKGALLGTLQAGLFYGAGDLLQSEGSSSILGSSSVDAFVSHGLVGGLTSVAGGGNFGSGFLAAGLGTLAPAPNTLDASTIISGTVESAVLGGAASILGGGKFLNGAETGAFGYLFNCLGHPGTCGAKDIPDIRQEASDCLAQGAGSCMDQVRQDAEQAGIMTMSDPNQVLPEFMGGTMAIGAAGPYAIPAARAVATNGTLAYQIFDLLINPLKETAGIFLREPPPQAELEDIPEGLSDVEKFFDNLGKKLNTAPKTPPKN